MLIAPETARPFYREGLILAALTSIGVSGLTVLALGSVQDAVLGPTAAVLAIWVGIASLYSP